MKRIVSILLAMALMITMAAPAFANDGTATKYTTTSTNAYASPDTNSKILAVFGPGKDVITYPNLHKDRNGFTYCFTNETEFCYIPTANLTSNPGAAPYTPPVETGVDRVVCGTTNYLALRSAPSRQASTEIGKLYNGDMFFVKEFRQDGFAYGRTRKGQYGYVVADYLEVPGAAATSTTYYAGHDWSAVYDYEFYKNNNPDVVAACGTNPQALIAHFVNNGIYEGRQGRADWNVYTYMSQHPDLVRVYGNDLAAYYMIACGLRP